MLELRKLRRGLFLKLPSSEVIDLVRAAGFDFGVVDLEHSQLSEADARSLVRHARAIGLPALVRLPELDRGLVNRLLEAGAAGIQLSTVRRAEQVRALRAATRYAPAGTRSISLAHPRADYGGTPLGAYLAAQAEDPPLVVAQIETAETDDPLGDILAERPDVVFLGMTDLTVTSASTASA
jgi:4-hydroxy-2-oxoheptanedioate aldolase